MAAETCGGRRVEARCSGAECVSKAAAIMEILEQWEQWEQKAALTAKEANRAVEQKALEILERQTRT